MAGVVFIIKRKRLIERTHRARLAVGMSRQAWINKAMELACEWAENQAAGEAENDKRQHGQ